MQMAVAEPAEGGTGRKNLYFLPQMDIVILKKCFIEIHLGMGRDILAPLLVLYHKYLSRQHKHTFVETKDVFVVTATCLFCNMTKMILGAAPANDTREGWTYHSLY